jgi:hypothetical protein
MTSFPPCTHFSGVVSRPLLDFAGSFSPECLKTHVPALFMELNNVLKSNCNQNSPERIILLVI